MPMHLLPRKWQLLRKQKNASRPQEGGQTERKKTGLEVMKWRQEVVQPEAEEATLVQVHPKTRTMTAREIPMQVEHQVDLLELPEHLVQRTAITTWMLVSTLSLQLRLVKMPMRGDTVFATTLAMVT